MIQYSFNIETKVMETSDLMAWECKSFTYGFLGFQPTENRDMKLQSKTSYMSAKNHKTHITSLIQILYKTPLLLKP